MRRKKNIALFEGCSTSPTWPSDKNSIRLKISMGSDGVILWQENRNWPAPMPICPPQFPLELALDWSRESAVRCERLTAESWHVLEELRLYKQYLYIHLLYRTEITGYPLQKPTIKFRVLSVIQNVLKQTKCGIFSSYGDSFPLCFIRMFIKTRPYIINTNWITSFL